NDLRKARGLTYVFITHDLAVVRNIADRVMVLKDGARVEIGETAGIFSRPEHSYTRGLIAASPVIAQEEQELRDRLRKEIG
ncbi:MAG: ABC transporter ATP-binding protein, partial [Albidovulum sp.]|nr:ABC transporter ATP-binding protein [Albidovulum sp.]